MDDKDQTQDPQGSLIEISPDTDLKNLSPDLISLLFESCDTQITPDGQSNNKVDS